MAMNGTEPPEQGSLGGDMVRLGLKLGLSKRGEYLVEFLDQRRAVRQQRRLAELGTFAKEAGLESANLVERIEDDDDVQEFVEEVLSVAQTTRSQAKLRYLGRCLAAALSGDDAAIDTGFMKLAAVQDVEGPHIRLLGLLERAARERVQLDRLPLSEQANVVANIPVSRRRLTRDGFPDSEFDSVMATIVRSGLVAEAPVVEVEVETAVTENRGVHTNYEADSDVTVDASTAYRLTLLGLELVDDARSSANTDAATVE